MPKIHQLPSGNYNALVYDYTDENGKRHYKSITAESKKEVKILVAEFLANKESESNNIPDITVGQAIDRYVASNRNILSAASIRTYVSIRRSAMQEIMDVPIKKVTSMLLQEAVDNFAENHAPKTVKERYALVVRCITAFLPDKKFKVNLPERAKKEIEIPTKEEVMKLLQCAKGTEAEIPLMLIAYCGMRPCEVSALRIEDINFEKGTAYIWQEYVRDEKNKCVLQDRTKALSSTRTIKLFKPVLDALMPLKGKTGFVTELKPDYIYRRNDRLIKDNNLKYYKPYTLRHYCVSVMLLMNIPKKYVADYVGHSSEAMVDTVYGHIMRDQKDDLFVAVEHFFAQMQDEMQDKKTQSQV